MTKVGQRSHSRTRERLAHEGVGAGASGTAKLRCAGAPHQQLGSKLLLIIFGGVDLPLRKLSISVVLHEDQVRQVARLTPASQDTPDPTLFFDDLDFENR